jgi:diguanylate cyclase (GGDEF)-like protein
MPIRSAGVRGGAALTRPMPSAQVYTLTTEQAGARATTVKLIEALGKRERSFWLTIGFALIPALGIIDRFTGPEAAFGFFYLIPVSLIAWRSNFRFALVASIACAIAWYVADFDAGRSYTRHLIAVWNATSRLGFFVVVSWLLSALKSAFDREHELARLDHITGVVNSRFFTELTQAEISRLARYQHPFTVIYIDLDNFKEVNDRFGHNEGDRLLRVVSQHMKEHLRSTDVVARLGGDEFACLLPETAEAAAREVIDRMRLSLVEKMQRNQWPVTLSMGVLTCIAPPHTVDQVIKLADELMYSVKNKGKNGIVYSTYAG